MAEVLALLSGMIACAVNFGRNWDNTSELPVATTYSFLIFLGLIIYKVGTLYGVL